MDRRAPIALGIGGRMPCRARERCRRVRRQVAATGVAAPWWNDRDPRWKSERSLDLRVARRIGLLAAAHVGKRSQPSLAVRLGRPGRCAGPGRRLEDGCFARTRSRVRALSPEYGQGTIRPERGSWSAGSTSRARGIDLLIEETIYWIRHAAAGLAAKCPPAVTAPIELLHQTALEEAGADDFLFGSAGDAAEGARPHLAGQQDAWGASGKSEGTLLRGMGFRSETSCSSQSLPVAPTLGEVGA